MEFVLNLVFAKLSSRHADFDLCYPVLIFQQCSSFTSRTRQSCVIEKESPLSILVWKTHL